MALTAALAACGAVGGAASQTGNVAAGRIVIQLFDAPGFIYPSVNGVPEWTLFGDGTLIFRQNTTPLGQGALVSAHLTLAQVAHILDVVVNQRHFFASNQSSYGHRVPDTGLTLLYVSSGGQQKMVSLAGVASGADAQTQNVFAIAQYLQGYAPAGAQPYTPSGVALLAIAQGQASASDTTWSGDGVSLATVASHECTLLGVAGCAANATQTGVSAVMGANGLRLLRLSPSTGTYAQAGERYSVVVWPLMPDALHPQPGTSSAVRVVEASGVVVSWPLLT